MMKMEERMKNSPKGTIFTNSDFYDISNPDAVKMPLHRLYSSNKIYRLISGYYTIPHYSNVLHEYGYPSANAMAEKSLLRSMHGIFVRLEWYPSKRSFIHVIGHDMI
ncbi:MAG: DUF6088 family protein [[Clostridium] innocuum]